MLALSHSADYGSIRPPSFPALTRDAEERSIRSERGIFRRSPPFTVQRAGEGGAAFRAISKWKSELGALRLEVRT
jgi:hypothetical protein